MNVAHELFRILGCEIRKIACRCCARLSWWLRCHWSSVPQHTFFDSFEPQMLVRIQARIIITFSSYLMVIRANNRISMVISSYLPQASSLHCLSFYSIQWITRTWVDCWDQVPEPSASLFFSRYQPRRSQMSEHYLKAQDNFYRYQHIRN